MAGEPRYSTPEDVNLSENKGDKTEVNSEYEDEYTDSIDVVDISSASTEDVANANKAITLINGIYGYVNEYNSSGLETGNKIWLSLTPYEIAPRLADINLFRPEDSDLEKQIAFAIGTPQETKIGDKTWTDLEKSRKTAIKTNLSKAMTVGNRLQASRIVTNYLTEILNPRLDTRYGSKDNRVGQASRFLNFETGEESDRSAFLHIIPDLELSNGRIAIPFGIEEKKKDNIDINTGKRKIENYRTAFVPVNFNFVHSNYTLTIKEFILNSVSEQNREIYSLDKTFDGNVLRFFGSHPKIISLGGILSNFDDDLIGLEKLFGEVTGSETQTVSWLGTSGTGNQTAEISKKGSMRDVFLSYYNNFLKGTKARDYGLKIYLYYNWRIIEGFIIDLNVQSNGDNDNVMIFNANMVVKSESSVYEQGVGLGKSVPQNYYSKRFGAYNQTSGSKEGDKFDLDSVFSTEEMKYRREYRNYAIQSTINAMKIGQSITKNKDYPSDIYMQLLFQDDPFLVKPEGDKTITITESGKKLEQPITDPELKKLINFYLYKLIVSAWRWNRKVDTGKVVRDLETEALLQDDNSITTYPYPNSDAFESWLTDTTENREGAYYAQLWDSFKQQNIRTFAECFIKGLSVDGHMFKIIGPGGANLNYLSPTFINFLNGDTYKGILKYIYNEWIINSNFTLPGDYSDVATLSLSSAMGYRRDVKALLK
jgi:hypothetical protein